eukprot:SAG25_NODE_7013_length_512_cov_0.990315_1_plen_42_part_10
MWTAIDWLIKPPTPIHTKHMVAVDLWNRKQPDFVDWREGIEI